LGYQDVIVIHLLTFAARRYEKEFENVQDVFELQRNLNNAFAYDLVPSPSVVIAALRAARRVNDFPTAVRIFEGTFLSLATPQHFESTY
jgi:cytochrome c oxidase subunit 5a